jgi:thiol:disulfide interchange protein DsbC
MPRIYVFLMAALAVLWQPAIAEDPPAGLLEALEKIVPGVAPDTITAAPVAGLYEVSYGPTVIYVTADGRYLIQGDLVDMSTRRNLTRARQRDARREAMRKVKEEDMIVFGDKSATHTVTVFTDVDCPYCVRLHKQMAEYNRLGIRIRYLAFPRAGIPSGSYTKTVSVWCADDPHQAIGDAKFGRPVEPKSCDNPVREQFALGQTVGVRGTPSLILESGELVPGYVPPRQLLQMIQEGSS